MDMVEFPEGRLEVGLIQLGLKHSNHNQGNRRGMLKYLVDIS